MGTFPVILCGGSGTRLWPMSRPERPKQFAALVGPCSTFQAAARRVSRLGDVASIVVVAGRAHQDLIRAQLAEIGLEARLIIEPAGRDSAAAIAAAAVWIEAQDPTGVAVVVAADHDVPDEQAFAEAGGIAVGAARDGAIVTFGVRPTSPSTAYGYIRMGPPARREGVFDVAAFVEKPDAATAERYLAEGCLWNSGNFVFDVGVFLGELREFAPEIEASVRRGVAEAQTTPDAVLLGDAFLGAPKISVDYAVLERSRRAAVIPVSYPWSDLGAWDAVLAASPKDDAGNSAAEAVRLLDCADTLVRAPEGLTVAAVGVRNLAVIVEPDAVLVCDLAASQSVKRLVETAPAPVAPANDEADLEAALAAEAADLETWRRVSAWPIWSAIGYDHADLGFREVIGMDGRPRPSPRRLRVQARQTYVFAEAGLRGWDGPWRAMVRGGLETLDRRYRRPDGAYRTLAGEDGTALDDTAMLYDQAFVLFAFAAAAKAGVGEGAPAAAGALLTGPLGAMRNASGGFRETGPGPRFQSNPHMHLLEAALAWEDLSSDGPWSDLADEIVRLAARRFANGGEGPLREFFDDAWAPAEGRAGRVLSPGHQFEWAWLLDRWAERRGDDEAGGLAARLFEAGLAGLDRRRNVAIDEMLDDFTPVAATARLWPQTERLKAALRLARRGDARRRPYLEEAVLAARSLRRYLETPVAGLWRDKLGPDDRFVDEPAPASSFYHLTAAISALEDWVAAR